METLIISLIPKLAKKLLSEAAKSHEKKEALLSLKKILLIECRINLKILLICRNKNIDISQTFKLLANLNNEACISLYSYIDNTSLKCITKDLIIKKDKYSLKDDQVLVSIISKIELLKILSKDFKNLSDDKIINIRARINNLHDQLQLIVKQINSDIQLYKD